MHPSGGYSGSRAAKEAELARCLEEREPRQRQREEAVLSSGRGGHEEGADNSELNDLRPLAEEAMYHLLMELATADEAQKAGAIQDTYEPVRELLRQLARVVPLPSDYAKAWKAKYPATKKGPSGEPVRQRNMGGPKVPYTEEPLRRAFGAIVQHAATWSALSVEEVLTCWQREVQKALLEDIGIRLPDWVSNLNISKRTCDSLRILAEKCHDSPVKEVKPANHPHLDMRGLEDENFQPTLRTESQRPGPEMREQQILAAIEAFAQEFPGNIEGFLGELARRVESVRPPRTERTLNTFQAAQRISLARGIHLDATQLKRWFLDPNIQIGAIGPNGKPVFSEVECDSFELPDRKPGRPAKKI